MADYYPLIARAVAGLEKNTGDNRRALYERARTALVAQLRGVTPALTESDITRERLALEEAIRKVEAESSRQAFAEPARAEPVQKVRPPEMPKWEDLPLASGQGAERRTSASPRAETLLRRSQAAPQAAPQVAPRQPDDPAPSTMFGSERYVDPVFDQPMAEGQPAAPQRHPLRARPPGERRSLLDSGVPDFRHRVSETKEPGEPSPGAAKTARERLSEPPPDQREPPAAQPQVAEERARDGAAPRMLEPAIDDETQQMPARVRMAPAAEEMEPPRSRRGLRDYIKVAAALFIAAALAGSLLVLWPTLSQLYGALRVPTELAADPANNPTGRVKNPERFEAGGQVQQTAAVAPGAAVAQRVVLYEEDPGDPQGKRFVGSAIWRTETVSPGPGLPPELAIRADVEIPERRIAMTWSLRRNADTSLPASHTVEIMFKLPQDFSGGGVSNVPGILMKQAEQTRGTPLSGLAVKVTNGFFLIGLSSIDADRERNVQLLKERAWFDIPVVYNNNRRAILALEKGTPGERAFAEAFRVWRQ